MLINLNLIGTNGYSRAGAHTAEPFTVSVAREKAEACIRITGRYRHAFGLGECFDTFDQAGKTRETEVFEKFTEQGSRTYLPVPFFLTDTGIGIYFDTERVSRFTFADDITVRLPYSDGETLPDMHCFSGAPAEILTDMASLLGKSPLPPRWAFGPWMSANRWNSQEIVESEVDTSISRKFPATVIVIEAWSDEATFYLWNEAEYRPTSGKEALGAGDLSFPDDSKWPSPSAMIRKLHDNGIRLVLWQVPVLKKLEPGRSCLQHDFDIAYAVRNRYIVMKADGTPYVIPDGHWFSGSYVPDFTNPDACEWWFSRRRYLTEIGVDGFKTDGGEFIYDEQAVFADGRTGKEMKNSYPALYTEAYTSHGGPGQVLFSRAGYTGSRKTPIHWAGDQVSTWDEMRHVLTAGLSSSLSGIHYWSFDIAGFAGPMPDPELYFRSVQWAVFAPVMQWHSEPLGGQFSELMASADKVNDRSPWNVASYHESPELEDRLRFHFAFRMNLLPGIYSYAVESEKSGLPMMRPLFLDFPDDARSYEVDDEYLFGRLLVAPVLSAGQRERDVWLPAGTWTNLWNGSGEFGPSSISVSCGEKRIPVFIRSDKALLLELDSGCAPGVWNRNGAGEPLPENLYLALGGETGIDVMYLDSGKILAVRWDEDEIFVEWKDETGIVFRSERISRKEVKPVAQETLGIPVYPVVSHRISASE